MLCTNRLIRTLVARENLSRNAIYRVPQGAKDLFSAGLKGSDSDIGATTREILVYISVGGWDRPY